GQTPDSELQAAELCRTRVLRGGGMERALRLGHITAASALKVTGDHGPLPEAARIERLLDLPVHGWEKEANARP
ncbi:hypothetical protein O3Q52_06060, partial [Streptomyces sp. ActVer]|nr:hypothetical protein [Streptomyces sp. ActVer]